jgi:hypothetical protein
MRGGTTTAKRRQPDGLMPTPERLRQGPVVRQARAVEDPNGVSRTTMVWQGLDTLARMVANGSITPEMEKAGNRFHFEFHKAGLDGLYAADPTRVPVQLAGGGQRDRIGHEGARWQVSGALDALGGMRTPSGSCAWHCLGLEMSLRAWALNSAWARRRIDHAVAAGILIADLSILQAYWNL